MLQLYIALPILDLLSGLPACLRPQKYHFETVSLPKRCSCLTYCQCFSDWLVSSGSGGNPVEGQSWYWEGMSAQLDTYFASPGPEDTPIHHACRHQELAVHCRQVICNVRRQLLLLQCLPLMCIALQHDGASLQAACRPMRSQHTMRCSM